MAANAFMLIAVFLLVLMVLAQPLGRYLALFVADKPLLPRTEGALAAPVPEGVTASGGFRERQQARRGAGGIGLSLPGPGGLALAGAALILGAELLVGARRRAWTRY